MVAIGAIIIGEAQRRAAEERQRERQQMRERVDVDLEACEAEVTVLGLEEHRVPNCLTTDSAISFLSSQNGRLLAVFSLQKLCIYSRVHVLKECSTYEKCSKFPLQLERVKARRDELAAEKHECFTKLKACLQRESMQKKAEDERKRRVCFQFF